jgi:hypothetical protein
MAEKDVKAMTPEELKARREQDDPDEKGFGDGVEGVVGEC